MEKSSLVAIPVVVVAVVVVDASVGFVAIASSVVAFAADSNHSCLVLNWVVELCQNFDCIAPVGTQGSVTDKLALEHAPFAADPS